MKKRILFFALLLTPAVISVGFVYWLVLQQRRAEKVNDENYRTILTIIDKEGSITQAQVETILGSPGSFPEEPIMWSDGVPVPCKVWHGTEGEYDTVINVDFVDGKASTAGFSKSFSYRPSFFEKAKEWLGF